MKIIVALFVSFYLFSFGAALPGGPRGGTSGGRQRRGDGDRLPNRGGNFVRPDPVPFTCDGIPQEDVVQCGVHHNTTGVVTCRAGFGGNAFSTCADPENGKEGDVCGCCDDDTECEAIVPCDENNNSCVCDLKDRDGNVIEAGGGFLIDVPDVDQDICVTSAMSVSIQLMALRRDANVACVTVCP